MRTIALDPGNDTGWALFGPLGLISCGCLAPEGYALLPQADRGIVEMPQVYQRSKATPADILALTLKVGRLQEHYARQGVTLKTVLPREWKKQVPKDICHTRGEAKLTESERLVVYRTLLLVPKGKRHNVWDAICLGLWELRR